MCSALRNVSQKLFLWEDRLRGGEIKEKGRTEGRISITMKGYIEVVTSYTYSFFEGEKEGLRGK